MKLYPSILLISFTSIFTSCSHVSDIIENTKSPSGYDLSDEINPLYSPGALVNLKKKNTSTSSAPNGNYEPGSFVEAIIPNTHFYTSIPDANQDADRTLILGAPLKVVKVEKDFVQVVDLESGDIGFVPKDMVSDQPTLPDSPEGLIIPDGLGAPEAISEDTISDDPGGAPTLVENLGPEGDPEVKQVSAVIGEKDPSATKIEDIEDSTTPEDASKETSALKKQV